MNGMSNLFSADKMMNRMFRKAEGVVWDLMTGKIGVQTADGIATLEGEGEDAKIVLNLVDDFSVALPAYAQSTPIAAVNVGDIIYSGKERISWVVSKTEKAFRVMKPSGETTSWTPPKVAMLGMDTGGVMVLRSLMSMLPGGSGGLAGLQSSMLPMLMMGGGDMDMEKIMPLMLMSQMGAVPAADGSAPAANPMAQMMPMMLMMSMMKGDKSPLGSSSNSSKFR